MIYYHLDLTFTGLAIIICYNSTVFTKVMAEISKCSDNAKTSPLGQERQAVR